MNHTPHAGGIALVFFDDQTGEVVTIGGAAFATADEAQAAWDAVPDFDGESSFMADRYDPAGDIVDDRVVSAETCAALMGQPIAELIEAGRQRLAAELASLTIGRARSDGMPA